MKPRDLLALGLLVLMIALERLASSGMYTVLSLDMTRRGSSMTAIGIAYAVLQVLAIGGMLSGGALALGIGPRATAAAGAAVTAAGYFLLGGGGSMSASTGLVAFGGGMLMPAVYAAGAEILAWDDPSPAAPGPHRLSAVAAFMAALIVVGEGGGMLGPAILGPLATGDLARVYRGGGVAALLAALLAAAAAALAFFARTATRDTAAAGPYRANEAPPASADAPLPAKTGLVGVAILLAAQTAIVAGGSLATPFKLLVDTDHRWAFMLMPGVRAAATLPVLVALVIAAALRSPRPPLVFHGAGLAVLAVGLALIAAAGDRSMPLYVAGAVVGGAGQAFTGPIPTAYAAIAVRGRAATLAVAGWTATLALVGFAARTAAGLPSMREVVLWMAAVFCLAGGVALILHARRLHGEHFTSPQPAR